MWMNEFKVEYDRRLLQFLWRQWSALGVAGYGESQDPWCIDPEALLLFSTVAARKDPRLFDEILDWLQQNASWLNLQRITRIRKDYDRLGDAQVLAAIGSHLSKQSEHHKWKAIGQRVQPNSKGMHSATHEAAPVLLFSDRHHFGETDPDFLALGILRPPIVHRGLSQAPRCDRSPAFLFKLRNLFGRQSRAEIIAWLLAHEDGGHPAEIARQTNYFRRSIQVVLNELERSGLVQSFQRSREKNFTLRHSEWSFLLPKESHAKTGSGFPLWIQWPRVFCVLQDLQSVLNQVRFESMSPALQAIQIRKVLDFDSLQQAGLRKIASPIAQATGTDYIDAAFAQINELLD